MLYPFLCQSCILWACMQLTYLVKVFYLSTSLFLSLYLSLLHSFLSLSLSHIYIYIYIYLFSSHTDSPKFPASFILADPIVAPGLLIISCVHREQVYVILCWSAYTGMSMYVTTIRERRLQVPIYFTSSVFHVFFIHHWWDGRLITIQLLFCEMLLSRFVQRNS